MSPIKLHVFGGSTRHQKMGMCMIQGCANLCSTSMSFLRFTCDAARGLQCPKETCKIWTGRKSIGDTFFQTTMTHVINFFASFPVVKQEHVEGNTGYMFPSSVYWFAICDGRNCELLNSMMTQICLRNRPHRVVKQSMSSYELNPPKQKVVNLQGLGG